MTALLNDLRDRRGAWEAVRLGGTRTAGGVGHEGRCLAWAAAYMLAEEPLPRWASGRRVTAVGGQMTNRPVDDIALLTDDGGWVTIHAKKGMRVDRRVGGGLGEAVRQLVDIDRFITFLDSEAVSNVVQTLTSIAPEASWESLAGP